MRVGSFSYSDERRTLKQFEEMLQQRNVTIPNEMIYAGDIEATLLRFLRARKYDLEKAMTMLEGTIKWRQENNVDQILNKPLRKETTHSIRANKPAGYIGFDRAGRPIYVDRLGLLNQPQMEEQGVTEDDFVKYHIQEMEYMGRLLMREASERAGQTIDQVAMIMDLKGLTLKHFSKAVRSLMGKLFSIDADNYPETNGGTYIVNIPAIFSIIWSVIEPWLDKRTRAKIQLLRGGDSMRKTLLQAFDADMLPTFLGGSVDFDEQRAAFTAKVDRALQEFQEQEETRKMTKDNSRSATGVPSPEAPPPGTYIGSQPSMRDQPVESPFQDASLPAIRTHSSDHSDDDSFYTPKSHLSSNSLSFSIEDPDADHLSQPSRRFQDRMPPSILTPSSPQAHDPPHDTLHRGQHVVRQVSESSKLPPIGEDQDLGTRQRQRSSCCACCVVQ